MIDYIEMTKNFIIMNIKSILKKNDKIRLEYDNIIIEVYAISGQSFYKIKWGANINIYDKFEFFCKKLDDIKKERGN